MPAGASGAASGAAPAAPSTTVAPHAVTDARPLADGRLAAVAVELATHGLAASEPGEGGVAKGSSEVEPLGVEPADAGVFALAPAAARSDPPFGAAQAIQSASFNDFVPGFAPVADADGSVDEPGPQDPSFGSLELAAAVPARPTSGLPSLPFATLTAFDRILQPSKQRDRTFFIALGIVFLMHLGALVGTLEMGEVIPDLSERQGQVEHSKAIAVELVEAPSEKSPEKASQMGKVQPPAPPPQEPPPPQPPPPPQLQQPPVQQPPQPKPLVKAETKPIKPPEKPVEKPAEPKAAEDGIEPTKDPIELAKATLDEAAEAMDAPPPSPPSPPTPPPPPPKPEATEYLGAAPEGKEREYGRAVREILARTKPQLWIRKAEVRIGFLLSPTGEIRQIKILQSSNDPVFDDVVTEWIKRAKFGPPPPNPKPDDLAHVIHYVVQ